MAASAFLWLLSVLLLGAMASINGALVENPLVLTYHHGPLLTTTPALDVHLLWYGKFSAAQRSIVADFIESLAGSATPEPSVAAWWKTTGAYKDASNKASIAKARLGLQALDETYSMGKLLKRSDIARIVSKTIASKTLPAHSNSVYLVLTAPDVGVERFCMSACGFHDKILTRRGSLPFAWVGNSETQCPGTCAWPFHQPMYGPQTPPLIPPNGDVGVDGMIINIATELANTVTNPFNTGYYQGDALAPLEAASACTGQYATGAYPGYPGDLPVDKTTGASYNAHGANGRLFLLPAMWDPKTRSCKSPL
eukprot:TRINITY_DN1907_c0_g1_i1.p1 TRINITY_DN1907_c0_g1~~TRINITY_DN1907_c0_g1_i1.p1  ORF type:complete len:310 (+),score=-29.11 TRINITY_DN1907_c0_g1_i1:172-1101(+)